MNVIEIKNLTKDYGNSKGIFDVSFSVKKGEVFGFLGPNGAGKTTTIRHLMGFIRQDKGICEINGKDCFLFSDTILKDVGYIPGEISFMNEMTGIQFIKFMAEYRGLSDLGRANELIKLFDLDPNGKIKKMSKGMKQKIGIVVAFMHDPSILILDEPTSGLDPLMQNRFIELIKDESKRGKTIIMSSHIFEEIEKTCTRVSIIKNGRIVAIDSIDKLKKSKTKKYIITLRNSDQIKSFSKEDLEFDSINEQKAVVIVKDNMKEFLNIINKYDVVDIDIYQQTLEDIFMDYYGGDNND